MQAGVHDILVALIRIRKLQQMQLLWREEGGVHVEHQLQEAGPGARAGQHQHRSLSLPHTPVTAEQYIITML